MSRISTRAFAFLLVWSIPFMVASAAGTDEEAKAAAVKALDAGAILFDAKDATGLAGTYIDDAVLTVVTRDSSTRGLKKEVKYGRAQIEEFYESILKPESTFHAKNHVDYARFVADDVLLIGGSFTPDATASDLSAEFVQVRAKEGDNWKIMNIQVFYIPSE